MRLVLALLLLAPAAFAQALPHETPGRVVGTVADAETGERLAGAPVFLEGTARGAATDADGAFVIDGLPPGDYTVVVSFLGFRPERRRVRVLAALDSRLDAALPLAEVEICEFCRPSPPLLARGVYAARVVTYAPDPGGCWRARPGDRYTASR